jgi:hypothetical protein
MSRRDWSLEIKIAFWTLVFTVLGVLVAVFGTFHTSSEPAIRTKPFNDSLANAEAKRFLHNWIQATNSGDYAQRLNFYRFPLERFYLQRDFTREGVIEEWNARKGRFATEEVGEPFNIVITRQRDDRLLIEYSKLMELQKINGELQTLKTNSALILEGGMGQWKIVSERDYSGVFVRKGYQHRRH